MCNLNNCTSHKIRHLAAGEKCLSSIGSKRKSWNIGHSIFLDGTLSHYMYIPGFLSIQPWTAAPLVSWNKRKCYIGWHYIVSKPIPMWQCSQLKSLKHLIFAMALPEFHTGWQKRLLEVCQPPLDLFKVTFSGQPNFKLILSGSLDARTQGFFNQPHCWCLL